MSQPPVVPYTPILRRYHEINSMPEAGRYAAAQALAADPRPLVELFLRSIEELATGYTHDGTFRPIPRVPKKSDKPGISNGNDLARHFYDNPKQRLRVVNDPELDVRWVNYELSILSTPGAATFDVPKHGAEPEDDLALAGRAVRADLVMTNTADRSPVLGEVKVRRDKDPFAALVQLLTYIAHLSTPSQYARLRSQLPEGEFPDVPLPRFDGYLMLFGFSTEGTTWLELLMNETQTVAEKLLEEPAISKRIRRLVCLDLTLETTGELTAARRWRYPS